MSGLGTPTISTPPLPDGDAVQVLPTYLLLNSIYNPTPAVAIDAVGDIVVAASGTNINGRFAAITKYDGNLKAIWSQPYPDGFAPAGSEAITLRLAADSANSIYVAGGTTIGPVLFKWLSSGNLAWMQSVIAVSSGLTGIVVTPNDDVVALGVTDGLQMNGYERRFSSDGSLLGDFRFGCSVVPTKFEIDSSGTTMATLSNGAGSIRLDATGTAAWRVQADVITSPDGRLYALVQPDKIAMTTTGWRAAIIRIDPATGLAIWQRRLGPVLLTSDQTLFQAAAIEASADGVYVAGRAATGYGFIDKIDPDGQPIWLQEYSIADTLGGSTSPEPTTLFLGPQGRVVALATSSKMTYLFVVQASDGLPPSQ